MNSMKQGRTGVTDDHYLQRSVSVSTLTNKTLDPIHVHIQVSSGNFEKLLVEIFCIISHTFRELKKQITKR